MMSPACEPRLRDLLNDPIVQILMTRDAVVEATLLEVIDDIRRRMADSRDIALDLVEDV